MPSLSNIPNRINNLFVFHEPLSEDTTDNPNLIKFFNIYFPINFLIVLVLGTFAWYIDIPGRSLIPPIICLNILLLIPKLLFREIVVYTTIFIYPIIVIIQKYDYTTSLSCWYFVFINLFMISLLRIKISIFITLCILHLIGLTATTYILRDPHDKLWYLSTVTGYLTCALFVYILHLFQLNFRLVSEKNILIKEKESMLEKDRVLAINLQRLVKSVLHDYNNWTTMSNLGLTISNKNKQQVNKLLKDGVRGSNELSIRLKAVLESNEFAYLRKVKISDLIEMINQYISWILPIRINCNDDLMQLKILTDIRILENCFLNLCRNAKQAGATKLIIEFIKESNNSITVNIKDDGNGIPTNIAEKIFKSRIDNSDKVGSGTGLVGVKYNIVFMNNKIELIEPNSHQEKETQFRISGIKIVSD